MQTRGRKGWISLFLAQSCVGVIAWALDCHFIRGTFEKAIEDSISLIFSGPLVPPPCFRPFLPLYPGTSTNLFLLQPAGVDVVEPVVAGGAHGGGGRRGGGGAARRPATVHRSRGGELTD